MHAPDLQTSCARRARVSSGSLGAASASALSDARSDGAAAQSGGKGEIGGRRHCDLGLPASGAVTGSLTQCFHLGHGPGKQLRAEQQRGGR
ncbi:hypothetical protein NDU88_005784 [Pleurodeles waltl]|uniref:Uncharacterized protein n=1 Tax=Pleurodeles waltl TaxID=8319 RepID=A0AAV7RK36_PLEWA|nr:hypothetical protein NDU88_005784 [Pleurodeles waltl]